MTPLRRKNTYKLSPVQEGMLCHDGDAKNSGINIGQIVCSIDEPIDAELLKSAWRRVVDRHEALRSSFHLHKGEEPHQNVHREVALPWNARDLRALSGAEQECQLNRWLREDRGTPFELDRDPLFRLNLFRLGDEKWTLVWTFHQGILDSRSFSIVLTEVFRIYDAARRSEVLDLPVVRPYSDYIQFLHSLEISESDKYWNKTLRGFANTTPLATLEGHGGEEGYGEEEVQLSTTVTQALEELAIRERFTMNNAVQAAWAVVLSRYSDTADVIFGATRPCRGFLPRAGSMVGTFSNTLPVRVKIASTLSVFDLLRQIRASEIAVRDFEHTPLTRIESWSELPPTSPLFESVLIFDQAPLNSQMKSPYLNWTHRNVRLHEHTNCPLTLYAYAEPKLTLRLAYDQRRFGQANIQQALGHLQTILQDIATGIDKNASELQSRIEQQRREPIVVRNETKRECPQDEQIPERIEKQERTYPNTCFSAPPQIEQVVVPPMEDMSPAKATPPPVKRGTDNPPADQALTKKERPQGEQIPERIKELNRPCPNTGFSAPPQIEQVVIPPMEDMSLAKATPPPVKRGTDNPPADQALWSFVVEKQRTRSERQVPPVRVPSVPAPVVAVPPTLVFKVDHNRPPVEHNRPSVEHNRPPVEHNRPSEPFAWATELPRSAKVAARSTVSVRRRPALHSVLRELLNGAKGVVRATASAKSRFARPSGLREFLKSTKGAMRPAARVKKNSEPQFVLRDLLRSDCLPQQPADKLEARRTLRDSAAIVTIQPNGKKPSIFCIGALDGELNLFRTLSAGLGNDQPMYGLEPSGIKNDPATLMNVKKIARYYIDQLRAAGEDRPYCLVGYAFGGLVALEMSQQLRASGAEVPATVLIDTHYPAGCRSNEKLYHRMHRYTDHLQQVLRRNSDSSDRFGRNMFYSSISSPAAGSSQLTAEISKIQQRAADRYRTRPYPGRACILTASTALPFFDGGPKNGWDRIFNDNLSIYYEIPGDRGVINTNKSAGLMVRRLIEFIGGVEESRVVPALTRIAS